MPSPILTPYSPAAARNPIWMQLSADNYLRVLGSKAELELEVLTPASAGNTITFTWGDNEVIMTAAVSPTDSGLQFALGASATLQAQQLEAYAKVNYHLSRDFVITRAGTVITFTAREVGSAYTLTAVSSPGSLIDATGVTAGVPASYTEEYRVGIAVYVETGWKTGTYKRLPEEVASPDPDITVRFNLQGLLKPYVGYDWPDFGALDILPALSLQRRYYLQYFEVSGELHVERTAYLMGSPSSPLVAWNAGARRRDLLDWWLFAWEQTLSTPNRFLTNRGRRSKRWATTTEQHYLLWYNPYIRAVDENILVRARVHYTDGTVSSWSTRISDPPSGLGKDELGLIPIGWTQLDLGTIDPTKTPRKYEVYLRSGLGTDLTETYTVWIAEADDQELFFEFVNSFGGIETLRTKGGWEHGLEVDYREVTTFEELAPESHQGTHQAQLLAGQHQLEVSTGFMDRHELDALLDILFAPEVRHLDYATGKRFPVRLAKGKHRVVSKGTDEEHLYALNLTFLVDDPERAHSITPYPSWY